MTGHDLDLDAIRSVSENGNVRANRDQVRALCAEVDSLRAKLAAAEQERDVARVEAEILAGVGAELGHRAFAAEDALTAVRELLNDLAGHGLRCDLQPTVMFGDESHVYRQLTDYLRWLDSGLRERARTALAAAEQRQQERTVGRCGTTGPRIGNEGPPICALPAGHAGWHRGDESWMHGVTFAPEWRGPEPTLPANWFERDGLTDDGSRFAYCDAEGPEQAHCVLAQRHGGDHQWAWFTREQRARAEQPEPTPEQP